MRRLPLTCAKQRGFTIMELSIVLALSVMFLLSVIKIAIPTGQSLIKQAEVELFVSKVALSARVHYLSEWNTAGRCMKLAKDYSIATVNTGGQLDEYLVGSAYHFDTNLVRVKTRHLPSGVVKGLSVVIQTPELDYDLTYSAGFSRLSSSSPYRYEYDIPIRFYDEDTIYHQTGDCLQ
ncbi:prepilin-type N-terminal cleavage/methylation domain-containing protein [Vibrio barjaei]|nr:prepilin-type N-terminal cleavage/methylation domain-containing protein [Vibrio barjaei]